VSVWAVLVAAGSGERLGLDRPKSFAALGGRPLLAEPLERLEASPWIEAIVVAAPAGWEEPSILLAEEVGAGKVVSCVTGGATRSESVRAAVVQVAPEASVILVHDAARPLLDEEVVERVLKPLAEGFHGAVPALPLADTVKRVRGGEVVETLDRTDLVAVQTPQAFLADILRTALGGDVAEATDCASLVEAAGGRVAVVPGDRRLVKVTEPADLELVASLLGDESGGHASRLPE
jgi:2-C-methyl-D-erythritol 4-phosphate cytidylyltransferase